MAVKMLMTWNILPGREQEYFEFMVRDFFPGLQRLDLTISDGWFTMYGNQPQILTAAQMDSQGALTNVLDSAEWRDLKGQLLEYVEDFTMKVVSARGGFQL